MRAPDFWYPPASHRISVLATLLAPVAVLYGRIGHVCRQSVTPHRAAIPVICIGNLVAGGTGKTPVALAVADMLSALGRKPVFLTRGFGGREPGPLRVDPERHDAQDVGDEPLLLARAFPTIVARDRVAGARECRYLDADVIVMDDGFQNPSLIKDLSLIVIDTALGFGNGRVLPAGPLREPVEDGLARADAVILLGPGLPPGALARFSRPCLRAALQPDKAVADDIRGRRVVAFAGIGRPQKFFDTLRNLGAVIKAEHGFADHHLFHDREIARLKALAKDLPLITTEKDLVRLTARQREGISALPVRAMFEAPDALKTLLERAVSAAAEAALDRVSH